MTDRELDAAVAERVMGWLPWDWTAGDWDGPADATFFAVDEHGRAAYDNGALAVYERGAEDVTRYFAPSTDIAAAWPVHQTMCKRPFSVRRRYFQALQRCASVDLTDGLIVSWPDVLVLLAERMPRAICEAALEAQEGSDGR